MKLTYYGHSCFMVEAGGKKLLFDPFIRYNELAASVDVESITADYIFISHGHQDHVADAVEIAKRCNATIICAFELMAWFHQQGHQQVHPMNTGGQRRFDFGTVKCVVAQHSSVLPDGTYGANPMGFVVSTPDGDFYYSGDTALTMDMQLVPLWGKIKFAVLPIGDNFTMGAEDAALAAEWVKTDTVIGVHYDTFGYIVIDKAEATETFARKNIRLLLPAIGSTAEL
ncbi:MAG: metal-dependent hydrolase, partial [Chitinophagaceae bacterium]|nr:metal-dependent hydrolase [Chitinophagaceae bacterium]